MSEPLLQWHKEGDEWNLRARGKRTIATVFELKKSRTHAPPPHALTREQVETTISRFLSWHDCEPECDHDLREVLATDAAQRETMEQQAGEIERLDKDLGAERVRGNFYKAEIDRSDALLNQFGIPNIAHECGDMLKPVDERIELVFVRLDTINQQLAARTAERDEITSRWKHEFELRCKEEDKNDQLQARLTASEARVKRQGDVLAYLLDCGPEIVQAIQEAKSDLSEDYGEEQRQEREALREQLRTLQQAKEWTEARPKVAGWYWLRAPKHGWRDAVVWIEKDGDGPESYFYMPDDDSTPVDEIDGEWQGPLTPGEE